ncbi:MAG: MarR family transcriptional regulator [Caldilineaceae bacterium]|nr:MarR family transcriptional regulator [Caldilineaceae bacterium]
MSHHPDSSVHEKFLRAITGLGVSQMHGVELLRLIKMAASAYDAALAERMRKEDLSAPRWRILLRLWGEEEAGCPSLSPTQLSQAQKLSKNTVSAHLRSLEEQELIERELDAEDLRQFKIRLTARGRDLVRQITPGHMLFLNDLTVDLSPHEIESLQILLQKLHGSLIRHANLEGCAADATERTAET